MELARKFAGSGARSPALRALDASRAAAEPADSTGLARTPAMKAEPTKGIKNCIVTDNDSRLTLEKIARSCSVASLKVPTKGIYIHFLSWRWWRKLDKYP